MLFCIFLKVVMARALEIEEIGAVVSGTGFNNLKFADDIALIANDPAKLQSLIDCTESESKQFELTVSTAKTEIQCIPPEDHPMQSSIRGVTLKQASAWLQELQEVWLQYGNQKLLELPRRSGFTIHLYCRSCCTTQRHGRWKKIEPKITRVQDVRPALYS